MKLTRISFIHPVPTAADEGIHKQHFSDVTWDITVEEGLGVRLENRQTGAVDYGGIGNIASFRPAKEPEPAATAKRPRSVR